MIRIPKKKWYNPVRKTGWRKTQSASTRRSKLLNATDKRLSLRKRYVQAGRMINALANVTKDRETKIKARQDAKYFFDKVR